MEIWFLEGKEEKAWGLAWCCWFEWVEEQKRKQERTQKNLYVIQTLHLNGMELRQTEAALKRSKQTLS